MEIITNLELSTPAGLDIGVITGLKERLTQVEGTTAYVDVKITEFENDINSLKTDISANSGRIANNFTSISDNSAAISTNMVDI